MNVFFSCSLHVMHTDVAYGSGEVTHYISSNTLNNLNDVDDKAAEHMKK